MDLRYLIPLLKNEWKRGILILVLPAYYAWMYIGMMRQEVMFFLSSTNDLMFQTVFFMVCFCSFPESISGQKAALNSPFDTLEFFFSRAISRSSLF